MNIILYILGIVVIGYAGWRAANTMNLKEWLILLSLVLVGNNLMRIALIKKNTLEPVDVSSFTREDIRDGMKGGEDGLKSIKCLRYELGKCMLGVDILGRLGVATTAPSTVPDSEIDWVIAKTELEAMMPRRSSIWFTLCDEVYCWEVRSDLLSDGDRWTESLNPTHKISASFATTTSFYAPPITGFDLEMD